MKRPLDLQRLQQRIEDNPQLAGITNQLLDLVEAADQAGRSAPYGHIFNALHAVVVNQGPGLLAAVSETVAEAAVERAEAERPAPPKKRAPRRRASADR